MSKIGQKPVEIPKGVTARIESDAVLLSGSKGELRVPFLPGVLVSEKEGALVFSPRDGAKQTMANWGTMRALAQNAVRGVTEGFEKTLEIQGIGFTASLQDATLVLQLGFSHPVHFPIPEGVAVKVEKNTIRISGIDRMLVGSVAARIRELKKPEPYKGKGIRYQGEIVFRKAGKKVAGSSGGA